MLPRDNPVPAKRRIDYRPPAFLVDTLRLEFDLAPDATRVRADIAFRRNPGAGDAERAEELKRLRGLLGQAAESVDLLELSREAPQGGAKRPPAGGASRR